MEPPMKTAFFLLGEATMLILSLLMDSLEPLTLSAHYSFTYALIRSGIPGNMDVPPEIKMFCKRLFLLSMGLT